MNQYELIMLFDPALGEEKILQLTTKVEDKIKSLGGALEKTEKWGMKKLNSMIRKAKRLTHAYYMMIKFSSPSNVPAEVQAMLKVTENVARYFVSKAVENIIEEPTEKKEVVGKPLEAVSVGEIKGEPLGEPK
ncbi:30S ribosomal protein S6 [candidate division WOR-1 bacterium RIFOXYB2_FULL_48_7]|uniref:Small ribosomal subunit protein bS6 n=1 Tax=candidate division WOR-1 bacterium RIFOXYB2_FULL_48_7 TaxID=1802583 RepID=A0A1F4TQF6_UNCSA|nr:MAG: 30S ribosomal protein S6 [candidate division WOR-1 bacterium RIFOXYB2_FULL_48_7]